MNNTWYLFTARVTEDIHFLFVREQQTHTVVLANNDAKSLLEQLRSGDNTPFAFTSEQGADVSLPLDYVTPLFYYDPESQMMKRFIKRLARPQTTYTGGE